MPATVSWMALQLQKMFYMYFDIIVLSSHYFPNFYDANFSPVFSLITLFEKIEFFLIADDIRSLQPRPQGLFLLFYMAVQERRLLRQTFFIHAVSSTTQKSGN